MKIKENRGRANRKMARKTKGKPIKWIMCFWPMLLEAQLFLYNTN